MNAVMEEIIYPTLETLALDNGIEPDLLTAYADMESINDAEDALDHFQDNYQGIWDNLEAWAEDLFDQTGELESMPKHLRYYFDYKAYSRDCQLGGDIWTLDTNEGVAIFWNR